MRLSGKVVTLIYGRGLTFGLTLAIPLVLTRLMVKDEYGTYQQLVLLFVTLQAVLLLGLPQSLLHFYPRMEDRERRNLLMRQTFGLVAVGGAAALLLFGGAQLVLGAFWPDHELQPYLGLLGVYAACMLVVGPLQNLLIVEDRVRAAAASMIGFSVMDVLILPGATYLLPLWTDLSVVWALLWGITLSAASKALICLGYVAPRYLVQPIGGQAFVRRQLSYGVPVGLAAMVAIINVNLDKYLVSLFFSTSVFAVYFIGSLWMRIFGFITQSAGQVVIPLMSKAHQRERRAEIAQLRATMVKRLGLVFFALPLCLGPVARPLIELLFTSTYGEAVPIFVLYLLLLPSRPFGYGEVLMATGHTSFLFRLVLAMMVLNALLSYLLLQGFGLLGLPAATVTVTWLSTLLIIWRSNRILGLSLWSAYPWTYLWTALFVSCVAALPALVLIYLGLTGLPLLLGGLTLFGVSYLGLATRTGVLGPREWQLFRLIIPWGQGP